MKDEYIAIPHRVKAFLFDSPDAHFPEWFKKYIKTGKASITKIDVDSYITLYTDPMTVQRVYMGNYIVKNSKGTIFKLSKEEFIDSFVPAPEKQTTQTTPL